MARKPRTVYVCDSCGAESRRWEGRCSSCGEWNTLAEFRPASGRGSAGTWSGGDSAKSVRLADVDTLERPRFAFESVEFNRVLGGGMVPGSVNLVAGDPGIGKSTLLLAVAADAARFGRVLYITGEESAAQIKLRADRLGITANELYLLPATGLAEILMQLDTLKPLLVVVDSIQTVYDAEVSSEAGSITQIRECARRLTQWAKTSQTAVVLTGHVTKGGDIAGPRVLEHVVDVVLYLEGDSLGQFRLLRSVKNRFGSTNEVGVFEMTDMGMKDVADPSAHFLSMHSAGSIGSIIVPTLEGTRPMLVEVQALTNPSLLPSPRRVAAGVDYGRLLLVCAILTRRAGLSLSGQDVIVNVTGGARVPEPAADLPIALAIVSSMRDSPLRAGAAAVGELGLGGEVRPVSQIGRRIQEVGRLGLGSCIVPDGADIAPRRSPMSDVQPMPVSSLRQAISTGLARAKSSAPRNAVRDEELAEVFD